MIYGILYDTCALNHRSQTAGYSERPETCHTLLLRFDVPFLVLKIPAFPLDGTGQQHSPHILITSWLVFVQYVCITIQQCNFEKAKATKKMSCIP